MIPPELDAALRDAGVVSWRIWRDGVDLFHEVECDDVARMWSHLDQHPANVPWQAADRSAPRSRRRLLDGRRRVAARLGASGRAGRAVVTTTDPIPVADRLGPLGFGAATLGNLYEPMTDEQSDATVATAWAAGIRYFDTAPHYGLGLSERRLGRALVAARCSRTGAVISTKVGRLIEDGHPPRSDRDSLFAVTSTARRTWDFSADGVRRSLDDSLERLGLDRIDIAARARPRRPRRCGDQRGAARAVPAAGRGRGRGRRCRRQRRRPGRAVRHRERSRCRVDRRALHAARPARRSNAAARVRRPRCGGDRRRAVQLGSALHGPAVGGRHVRLRRGTRRRSSPEPPTSPTVCAEHGIELPEAALRFPLQHPAVATVLVGCRTPDEVNQNAARVAAADARESGAWDGLWAELRCRGLVETEDR